MSTGELLRSAWSLDAGTLFLASVAVGFVLSARPRTPQLGLMLAAAAALIVARASPLAALADGYLFSAHMVQHLLLLLVVPAVGLLGLGRLTGRAGEREDFGFPVLPWIVGASAMWVWHAPALCDAAARSAVVRDGQAVSLLVAGTVFWWPVFAPRAGSRLPPLGGVLYLFTACVACTLLGIAVTLSPVTVCSAYAGGRGSTDALGILPLVRGGWGMTPERDQQIGGLVMWVPACLVYGAGIIGQLARQFRGDEP